MVVQDVLDEFDSWLAEQPETPAKWWVQNNRPDVHDAAKAILVIQISVDLVA